MKVSVSEIKRWESSIEEDADSEQMYAKPDLDLIPLIPDFIEEKEELQGVARGTAYHKVMECLDFSQADTKDGIRQQLDGWVSQGRIEEPVRRCVREWDILALARSPLGKRLRRAQQQGLLYREQPFVISVKASEVDADWDDREQVLVQGIMDVYFQEEGDLVVVDYKTDWLKPGEEDQLTERYRIQLGYYGQALERMTGKRVKEKYLYSFCLGKALPV